MTIQQALKWAYLENNNQLPLPKNIITANERENVDNIIAFLDIMFSNKKSAKKFVKECIMESQGQTLTDEECSDEEIEKIIPKIIKISLLEVCGVEATGEGKINSPLILKTQFGEGKAFNASELFKKSKWPKEFKFNQCYRNSRVISLIFGKVPNWQVKQITGLAYVYGESFLHSVVDIATPKNRWILDSNYHIMLTYDLYMKLFSFEQLNEISYEELSEGEDYISMYRDYCQNKNKPYTYGLIALAHQDIVERAKKLFYAKKASYYDSADDTVNGEGA